MSDPTTAPRFIEASIPVPGHTLAAQLAVPAGAEGLVIILDGSDPIRFAEPRRQLAATLNDAGFATLLLDPLSPGERATQRLCFDVALLGNRLEAVLHWSRHHPCTAGLTLGLFGTSAGATGALAVAARQPEAIAALVTRGGRPDLLGPLLGRVRAPTLLVVDSQREPVLEQLRQGRERLGAAHIVEVTAGASYPFDAPETLEEAIHLARNWFRQYLSYRAPLPALEANEP